MRILTEHDYYRYCRRHEHNRRYHESLPMFEDIEIGLVLDFEDGDYEVYAHDGDEIRLEKCKEVE